MKKCMLIGFIGLLLILVNCGPHHVAPTLPNGDPIQINIKIDPNLVDSLTVDHQNARKNLSNWMVKNLDRMFRKARYKTQIVTIDQEMSTAGVQVEVKFIKVHFQNKAARFFAGIAAGPALLEIEYIVADGTKTLIKSEPEMIDSVYGEQKCAEYFNNKIFKEVHKIMQETYTVP